MEHENIYRAEQHTRPCLDRGQIFTRTVLYIKDPFQYYSLIYSSVLRVASFP